jgi:hypothetical protein
MDLLGDLGGDPFSSSAPTPSQQPSTGRTIYALLSCSVHVYDKFFHEQLKNEQVPCTFLESKDIFCILYVQIACFKNEQILCCE